VSDIYTIALDSEVYVAPMYSCQYTVRGGRRRISISLWADGLEAGRERATRILARMSREYSGRLPPGRYAQNNTIHTANNKLKRQGKR